MTTSWITQEKTWFLNRCALNEYTQHIIKFCVSNLSQKISDTGNNEKRESELDMVKDSLYFCTLWMNHASHVHLNPT